MMMSMIRASGLAATGLFVASIFSAAVAVADTPERLTAAAESLNALASIPENEKGIPADLIKKAQCLVVVPSLKSAALGVGGEYGRGFVSCRDRSGWTAPAAVKIEGGSFGLQIGGTETELVMLVMNQQGMNRLLSTKFTLGGDASVAAGPVGRSVEAQTDAAMTAEILSYSRARGVYAGVSLKGATLREDESANKDLYGAAKSNREILSGRTKAPGSASALMSALRRL
jgi:lipid-binding SYLF domain-containing protein